MTPCTWESWGLSKLAMSWRGPGRTGTNFWCSVTVSLPPMSLWAEIESWTWGDWGWSGEEGLMGLPGRKEQKVEPFGHFWIQLESPHQRPGRSLSPKASLPSPLHSQVSGHPPSCLSWKFSRHLSSRDPSLPPHPHKHLDKDCVLCPPPLHHQCSCPNQTSHPISSGGSRTKETLK